MNQFEKNINSLSKVTRTSFLLLITPLFFKLLFSFFNVNEKSDTEIVASMELNKLVSHANRQSGQTFYYTLQYRCASLIEDCEGVMITDPLPPEVQFMSVVGSAHTTNETYDAGTHTVSFEFIDPMPAGTSGELITNVRFNLGSVPDGEVVTNSATMTSDNAPTVISNAASITASANFTWSLNKSLLGSSVSLDQDYTYEIELCKGGSYFGALNWEDVDLIDTLPTGAVFVDASGSGVYDAINNTVTWADQDFIVTTSSSCPKYTVTINYPSANFNTGDIVTNKVVGTGTPVGEPDTTLTDEDTKTIIAPLVLMTAGKKANVLSSSVGSPIQFEFDVANTGNVSLDNYEILDTVPTAYNVTVLGTPNSNQAYGTFPISVFFQTNLNSSWQGLPGNPYTGSSTYPMSLLLGAGEHVTIVKWDFGTVPPGFTTNGGFPRRGARMDVTVNSGVANGDVIDNCADFSYEYGSIPDTTRDCASVTMVAPEPLVSLHKFEGSGDNFIPNDSIDFRLQLTNRSGATGPLENPKIADFLPEGLEYVSHTLSAPSGSPATIALTQTPDFNSSNRELLEFDFTGDLAITDSWTIYLKVRVKVGAVAGTFSNYVSFIEADNPTINFQSCINVQDAFDINNNGDTAETLCSGEEPYTIQDIAVLESRKSVIGQLDTIYSSPPDTGRTVPSGISNYKLEVWNVSTVPITDVVVVDILPFVGDRGVIDLSSRNSRWSPYLVDTVTAPTGVTIYYSTSGNPCRSAEGLVPTGPPGCDVPNWTTSPPADITTVQSLKFDFGSTIINPTDTLTLSWPMRTPLSALNTIGSPPDSLANNSFAYIGTRVDNGLALLPSEARAIGIHLAPYEPGVYGDFVWLDTDDNGLQDIGELGVNGVRVELYMDTNADGLPNPALDSLVNFTVTGDGGFYGFPELESGDYYSVIYLPTGYTSTSPNQGNDNTIDSDGWINIIGADTVAITEVTTILDTETDLSWDIGLTTKSVLGNYVWNDANTNGIQDESSSEGINGIKIYLYDNNTPTNPVDSAITADNILGESGQYQFYNVIAGDYFLELDIPSGINFTTQGSTGTTDPLDSDFNVGTNRTEVISLSANVYDNTWDAGILLPASEICGNSFDDDQDGNVDCPIISGTIFEDINYGGGDGRNYSTADASAQSSGWSADDIAVENVVVELYDAVGDFVASTTTNGLGQYSFEVPENTSYSVRVVNNTLTSNRTGNGTGLTILPVQVFRSTEISEIVNEVGGASPALIDANNNTSSSNISTLTTASITAQSVSSIVITNANVSGIDFGFNYDVIVNTNDSGQGSIRQFILNSNELDNTNLDQEDSPTNGVFFTKDAAWETSIFMIPGGGTHIINPTTRLESITDDFTHLSGYTQSGSSQNSLNSRVINVELAGNTTLFDGITLYSNDLQLSGLAIHSFRRGVYNNLANANNNFIWGNYVGTEVNGTTIGTNNGYGIHLFNVVNSFIGTNGDDVNDANEGNLIVDSYGGVSIQNTQNILIAGNHIGVDKTGIVDAGNTYIGVSVFNATGQNIIGFDDSKTNNNPSHFRNIISGNGTDGIRISDSDNQIVAGNYLGTDISGTVSIENRNYGIQLQASISNTVIGTNSNEDNDIAERNIISGNGTGLRFLGSSSGADNIIAGNFIGTDLTGNSPLPNSNHGLDLSGTFTGTIIGTNGDNTNDEVEGNVISGNNNDGIRISINDAIIAGNNIGVGYDNVSSIGNAQRGILVTSLASDNVFGYKSTMLNTDELVIGNRIMNNNDSGLAFSGTGTQNRISKNQMQNNGSLGIDLDYDGVSANDNGDGDIGSNTLLNFPVLESAIVYGNNLIITGFAPLGAEVEFFIADGGPNPDPLPSGYTSSFGEGARYLFTFIEGSVADTDGSIGSYTDDGTGAVSTKNQNRFEISMDTTGMNLSIGVNITATATNSDNNTSEFSGWTEIDFPEICDDGIDNDGDGDMDCNDSDCAPLANPASLTACDNSNETGSGLFFLYEANSVVSSELGVAISYHLNLTDAQNNNNILISPYNASASTIFARVENTISGCFSISSITLSVGAKCLENCNNGVDDDGDGLIDCDDPDCPCCKVFAPNLNGLNKK